ncbi:MAG: PQQ-binding-like beta-propeller repeat protein [Planctomycetes bacterium]|nr:PQQ-binding-like beta-propeller repeat protein [Planctomycetota bacterium]
MELAEVGDLHVGGSLVVRITSTLRVETLDLETGAVIDLGPLVDDDGPERRIVGVAMDPLQETLAYSLAPPIRYSYDFSDPPQEEFVAWLGEIDLRTGETSWRTTLQGSAGPLWLDRHQVVTNFDDMLLALDRVTGAVRWRAPLGRSRYPLGVEHAEGHLVCVSAELAVEARLTLRAFDLHTGEVTVQAQRVLPTRSLLAPLGWRAPVFWRPALALDDAGLRFLWPGHRDLIVLDAPSNDDRTHDDGLGGSDETGLHRG